MPLSLTLRFRKPAIAKRGWPSEYRAAPATMRAINVVGTRPNVVKIASLMKEMRPRSSIVPILVHTGEGYDGGISECLFTKLEIGPPDFNLGVDSGSHATQTGQVMQRLDPILQTTRPDLVVVVGDANSALGAALTAVKLGIPVAHVEAGLRSFDRASPEEINRVLTDAVAEFHFVTEESGRENLLREGIRPGNIYLVGNTMIDALQTFRPWWERSPVWNRLGLDSDSFYAVLTLEHPPNVDDPIVLLNFLEALQALARHLPIVFPLHPRVKHQLLRQGYLFQTRPHLGEPVQSKGIAYLDPLEYLDFVALMSRARLVLTDSGGIQEETTILGVPCLTLRDTTERPITITRGTNRIIGTDPSRIVDEALRTLAHPPRPNGHPPLWDGRAAERIVNILGACEKRA